MTEVEIAWLAGLLEGEGCFRLKRDRRSRRDRIAVVLKMTDYDVVQRAHKLCGLTCAIQVYKDERPQVSDAYRWDAGGPDAERIMRLVRPHMGQRRGAKIDELLSLTNLGHHPR